MKLPTIKGLIKRRILINYQVDPKVIAGHLPHGFYPKIVKDKAIIGVCLIRLEQIRPKFMPFKIGITSENVAHRIAIQRADESGALKDGVYIFRRDSNSWLNKLLGGRLFPGEHSLAKFKFDATSQYVDMLVNSRDGKVNIHVNGSFIQSEPKNHNQFKNTSLFHSLEELSEFFQTGAEGYSPIQGKKHIQGMRLVTHEWNMQILNKDKLELSFFKDVLGLSDEQLIFDSLVLMEDIPHEWQSMNIN